MFAKRTPSVTSTDNDAELLSRIAAGELEPLGLLFERHHHDVRRFLHRIGGGSDTDDLVQQTFLEVTGASRHFDGRSSARPWLFGIAATMKRRRARSLARMTARLSSWVTTRSFEESELPSETFAGKELEARFWKALTQLSAKKREVFVLVTLEGISGEEAAEALGVPVNTVWTRLHHARSELRHLLGEATP